tara:strand:+ start:5857 stop:6861 length:1005 start_codon:yes stop_codon:yes gene_type:complete
MKHKKIVLIGGSGFIGHNLAISLKNIGHEVHIVDSLAVNNMLSFTTKKNENHKLYWSILNQRMDLLHKNDIQINVDDARHYNAMTGLMNMIEPDVIIHLAAVSHANKANKDPHTTFDHSLRTLENTLDIARSFNSHLVYFSSSMVYGHFKENNVTEETICNPLGMYGSLKYAAELIVKAYNQVFDLPYTIIRPSALYGERCVSRRVGQIFIENAVQGKDITVQGDGNDKLDFTYIEDLIQGINLVIENKNSLNQTFNLTFGEARTIGEMAELLRKNFEGIEIHYEPKDSLTPDRGTLSVDKAKSMINYSPKYPIDIGYPRYIEWYKSLWKEVES